MNLEIRPDGFRLDASDIRWLFQDVDGFSVGVSPNGSLLALEADHDGAAAAQYQNFDDLYQGGCGYVCELPNHLLRKVAHALDIAKVHGVPVDEYFPDDDDEEDEDPPLLGIDIENGKPKRGRDA